MTSADNSVSEPPNLKIFPVKEDTYRPPYKAPAFGTRENTPPPRPFNKKTLLRPLTLSLNLHNVYNNV